MVENKGDLPLTVTIKFDDLDNLKVVGQKLKKDELSIEVPPKSSAYKQLEAIDRDHDCKAKFSYYCTTLQTAPNADKLEKLILEKGQRQDFDKVSGAELYSLPAKDAIYFLVRNAKKQPDQKAVKALSYYKSMKKKFKGDKAQLKTLDVPMEQGDHLKAKLECKLKFEKLKHLELEKPDSDDDTWKIKVPPGEVVVKKLAREKHDEPDVKYSFKLKSKFKFTL